jgi:ERI1 exoribonuclease 2
VGDRIANHKLMKHIVVDLEINRLGRKERQSEFFQGELIEIGAVMLDDDMNEISEYL